MTDKLFKLTLLPEGTVQEFASGTPLWEALLDMGELLKTPCGGKGSCGKCRVHISTDGGPYRDVLACRQTIDEDMSVLIDKKAVYDKAFDKDADAASPPIIHSQADISFAVDIGTTTVKMSLVDMATGKIRRLSSFHNPQRRYGHDVVSRIAAAADGLAMSRMVSLIREAVFAGAKDACDFFGIPASRVRNFILSGNTTMLCLFYGIDPAPIGRAPYRAPATDFEERDSADMGGKRFINAKISALPARAAYLGSDLVAGIAVCSEMDLNRNTFFIDLGTNGELFLADGSGGISAASCAMGPALEGMNMSCGMTADDGAITHIKTSDGRLVFEMVGDGAPAGITGTAIIDLVSVLLGKGSVTDTGAINPSVVPVPARYSERSGMREILLWGDISLTQTDIRSLQLAKAASLAASRLLLQKDGVDEDNIKNVILAGALGEHLDIDSFRRLGFIPDFKNAGWRFIGNTSLMAAEKACLDKTFSDKARQLRDRIEEIVLTDDASFMKVFIDAVNFPPGRPEWIPR